jgi:hypothetical protein
MEEQTLIKKIGNWFKKLDGQISFEDISEAKKLYGHDEWEMAFEIMLIGIINSEIAISDNEKDELKEIAIQCEFREEGGVSDYHIWDKFQKWSAQSMT